MASEGLHEEFDLLDEASIDYHRAARSLCEEIDAIDWYAQRVKATTDPSLAEILAHNRDDEKEHAAMILEWLRRRDPALDANLRLYLFTSESIVDLEPPAGDKSSSGAFGGSDAGSLGIGGLRGTGE